MRRENRMIITNVEELTSHGNIEGRRRVLDILEAGMAASDPYENTRKLIRLEGEKLTVGHPDFEWHTSDRRLRGREPLVFDLSEAENIYVVGGGKAAQRQAKAIEDVLGDRITEGQINAKKGEPHWCKRINVTFAGHPLPDEDGVMGAKRILEIEQKAKKGDIVFLSGLGGGTSLMTLPAPGLTLEDVREVSRMVYFDCGASMPIANIVRWHLVTLHDRHRRHVGDATLIVISTAEIPLGQSYHVRRGNDWGSTYQDAINILKGYGVWDKVPESVRGWLLRADPRYECIRPGELDGKPQYDFRVMGPEYMLGAARKRAEELGLRADILISSLNDVEASAAGQTMASLIREVEAGSGPFKAPCALILGGELTVAVGEATGTGGRNQEFALSSAPRIEGSSNIVIASADSDGTDGPTQVSGGIVDGQTMERAMEAGIDLTEELSNHNSHAALSCLGDTINTGARGTNVRDIRILYVGP